MLRNLVSVVAAAGMCVPSAMMIVTVPFALQGLQQSIDAHGLLYGSSIVLAVYTVIGGWLGYVTLNHSASLLSIRMMMLREGRDWRGVDWASFVAWVLWPILWHGDWDE